MKGRKLTSYSSLAMRKVGKGIQGKFVLGNDEIRDNFGSGGEGGCDDGWNNGLFVGQPGAF